MIFKNYGTTIAQLFHYQGVQKCKEKSLKIKKVVKMKEYSQKKGMLHRIVMT